MADQPTQPDQSAESTGPEPGEIIRAKWTMDGATTLAEAADRLEAFAAYLRDAHEKGWTLTEPVADDYGFLVSPTGEAGRFDPTYEEFDDEEYEDGEGEGAASSTAHLN